MQREIILTGDGSPTIKIPDLQVTYRSVYGAIQESQHVFIQAGLIDSGIFGHGHVPRILEIGFGTGLNALLTFIEAEKHHSRMNYTAIELYPLSEADIKQLNYCEHLAVPHYQRIFEKMHQCPWGQMTAITGHFRLTKIQCDLLDFLAKKKFFLIYFDAFSPDAQPALWTQAIFEKMYSLLLPGGRLVTYCSKGSVRRAMKDAGFIVEKLPGPKGKREITRAEKRINEKTISGK